MFRPDDGYHIHLTATFGSQVVKLRAGKTVFDVVFEIHEAEVLMRDLNTQLEYGSEYHEHNKILKDIKNEDTERVLERHRGVNVSSSAISAEISDNNRVTTRSSSRSVPINFDHASQDTGYDPISCRQKIWGTIPKTWSPMTTECKVLY